MPIQWYDHGNKGNKRDAEKFASWMRRGGFGTRLVKKSDGWHVETGTTLPDSERLAKEHAADDRSRHRAENPPPSPFTISESGSVNRPAPDGGNRVNPAELSERGSAKRKLESSSGWRRWLGKRERDKEVALTVPIEPKAPEREGPRNKVAEGAADIELAQSIKEEKNDAARADMKRDAGKHFLFRNHRYLPSMTSTQDTKTSRKGGPQIEPGAYRRQRPGETKGLYNMANDPDRRN